MKGKIITIAQQKGGAGKTTLTTNLAVALAQQGSSVGILDTDPQGSLGRWYMTRCETLGDEGCGLTFRTASAWGARYEAQQMIKSCDTVFIDTPPKMGSDGRPAIAVADLVVVPVSPSPLDVWATEPTLELIRNEDVAHCAVVTRCAQRTRMTNELDQILEDLNLARTSSRISNRIIFAEAMKSGRATMELRPSGPAALEIRSVLEDLAHLASAA